jgi:teichuronic acid biosynthesis glycosyltransferase TuaH
MARPYLMSDVDYDIIVLALPRWDGRYSSTAFSISKELSRYKRVFYIDNPFTVKDFAWRYSSPQVQRRRKALLQGRENTIVPDQNYPSLIVATPRLVWPINWLPPGWMYTLGTQANDRIVYALFRQLAKQFDIKRFVFINAFNPFYGKYFPADFKPLLRLYHCVDDISVSEYVAKHGSRLEQEVMRQFDITLVTSRELMRLKSPFAKSVYYLPNAADVTLFQAAASNDTPIPYELIDRKEKKIILYMGNVDSRLDYDLLLEIAKSNKDKLLLMVGPVSSTAASRRGLDEMDNVLFTGRKDLNELPAFVACSQCCIIPFLCNTLTRSIYPLKVNEYLSAGKPVVTTNFSEDIANFAGIVTVCDSRAAFLEGIRKYLDQPEDKSAKAQRMSFAAGNSWSSRAAELIALIDRNVFGDE